MEVRWHKLRWHELFSRFVCAFYITNKIINSINRVKNDHVTFIGFRTQWENSQSLCGHYRVTLTLYTNPSYALCTHSKLHVILEIKRIALTCVCLCWSVCACVSVCSNYSNFSLTSRTYIPFFVDNVNPAQ